MNITNTFHFHYFTQNTIKEHLVKFGKIIDSRRVLGLMVFSIQ